MLQVARELVDDTGVDLVGYLAMQAGRAVGNAFGTDLINGNGIDQAVRADLLHLRLTGRDRPDRRPAASPTYANLVDLEYTVIAPYRQSRSCYWIAADKTIGGFRKIIDSQLPADLGAVRGARLPGPAARQAAGGGPVHARGDGERRSRWRSGTSRSSSSGWSAGSGSSGRDDFAFGTDLVTFRCLLRGDGTLVDTNAIKLFKGGYLAVSNRVRLTGARPQVPHCGICGRGIRRRHGAHPAAGRPGGVRGLPRRRVPVPAAGLRPRGRPRLHGGGAGGSVHVRAVRPRGGIKFVRGGSYSRAGKETMMANLTPGQAPATATCRARSPTRTRARRAAMDPTPEPGNYGPSLFGVALPQGTGAPGSQGATQSGATDPTNQPGQLNEGISGEGPADTADTGAPGSTGAANGGGGPDTVTYTRPGSYLSGTYQQDTVHDSDLGAVVTGRRRSTGRTRAAARSSPASRAMSRRRRARAAAGSCAAAGRRADPCRTSVSLAAGSLAPTSQAGGNMMSSNAQAMTAPGSEPVDPLPDRDHQGEPTLDVGSKQPVGTAQDRRPTGYAPSPAAWKTVN